MPRDHEVDEVAAAAARAQWHVLHETHGRDVLAYALRRVAEPEDAADVVAETFLVAWRRASEVPAGAAARLWLFGVARRALANQARAGRRRTRLAQRLRDELPAAVAAVPPPGEDVAGVLAALARLGEEDREILLLTGWEELAPAEVARVVGLSGVAVRSRLHRARKRLRAELAVVDVLDTSGARSAPRLTPEEAR